MWKCILIFELAFFQADMCSALPLDENLYLIDLEDAPNLIKKGSPAVVRINAPNDIVGTGSWISENGHLFTVNHVLSIQNCIRNGCFLEVHLHLSRTEQVQRKSILATPIFVDALADISLFQIYEVLGDPDQGSLKKSPVSMKAWPSQNFVGVDIVLTQAIKAIRRDDLYHSVLNGFAVCESLSDSLDTFGGVKYIDLACAYVFDLNRCSKLPFYWMRALFAIDYGYKHSGIFNEDQAFDLISTMVHDERLDTHAKLIFEYQIYLLSQLNQKLKVGKKAL